MKMKKIQWDGNLSVGIDLIDEQHKMLIQRLNNLIEAIEKNQGVSNIVKTLDFMIKYTNFHFNTEEKHMTEKKYPGLDNHKKQHEEFKVSLNHMIEDFEEDGVTGALVSSVNVFLGNWLIKHIQGVDLEFGKYLTEKGFVVSEN